MTTSPPTAADRPSLPPRPATGRLAGVFLLAWIPRLALALVFLGLPIGLDDMYQYDMLGLSLARGNGYRWYQRDYVRRLQAYIHLNYEVDLPPESVPEEGYLTVFRAPGYPVLLAVIYRVVGEADRLAAVRLVQSALGALLAPLTVVLARRLRLPSRAALLAGIVVALYPILWMYPIGLGSENLFLLLTLAGVTLLLWAGDDRRPGSAITAGLVLASAALTRGVLALFLVFGGWWLVRRAGWRRGLLFGLAAAAVIGPWAVRNSQVLGRPAFIENSLGYNLFVGYHPEGDGGFVAKVGLIPTRYMDDGERDRWTFEQALGFMRDDPGRTLALLPRRLAYLVGFESRELIFFYASNLFGPIPTLPLALAYVWLVLPWVAVAAAAPFGLAAAEDRPGRDLSLLLVAATLIAYVPVLAEPRFHIPLVPFLAPFAATVWLRPSSLLRSRFGGSRRAYTLALAALLMLIALWSWDFARQAPKLASVLSPGGNTLRLDY
ncbi:MAG: PMT 2 protein [Anaerolineales bacterium]|nr:PMT 2 protein [Anaerolineales bacterium]